MDPLTPASARTYADEWIANWNRKDMDAVLMHFSDDVVFISPRAESITGSSRVEGKAKLKEYWTRALAQIHTIQFTLDRVMIEDRRVGIVYTSEINGTHMRTVEFLLFGSDGLIHEGEVMHGVTL